MINVHDLMWLSVPEYGLFTGIASIITLSMLYMMFSRLRRARWIEDTPTSKVRSAAQGLVEIKGVADAGGHAPLISPLGEVDCLWYRFSIEEYRRSGKSSNWQTVEKGASERPFLLRDDTGSCWINPVGADVHPRQRRRWEGRQRWPAGKSASTGILGMLIGKKYRYTEEWFAEEEIVYALGWFESRGGGREQIDQQSIARQVISQWKSDFSDLLARFDRNADGELDMQEWAEVRAAADSEAARRARIAGQAPVVHMLGKPPHKGLPYILSDHHEEDLSRRLRNNSRWSMLGLVVSGAVSGWLWLALITG